MTRVTYVLKKEELEILLNGMIAHGTDKTYIAMKNRTVIAMQQIEDADEILMDQYDTVLKKARSLNAENNDEKLQKTLYQLASLLRILAHEIYREYLKAGKERGSKRFLHIVK